MYRKSIRAERALSNGEPCIENRYVPSAVPTQRRGNAPGDVRFLRVRCSGATELLAIDAYERPTAERAGKPYALHVDHCARKWGMSPYGFKIGIRILCERSGLDRSQPGRRRFAAQRFSDAPGDGYVALADPEGLLRLPEDQVAAIAAAHIAPDWRPFRDIARRIGTSGGRAGRTDPGHRRNRARSGPARRPQRDPGGAAWPARPA